MSQSGSYIENPLTVPKGGTGVVSITDHALVVGSGTDPITVLAAATDGQLCIGSTGADPAIAALSSTGGSVTITNGAGTINLEAAGVVALQFDADGGSAVPALNVITMAGGTNITTSGAGSTVTFNLDAAITGTTSHDFATGGRIGTALLAGNTLTIDAYDVDGAVYTTFATLTANNTPTMDLDDAVTKASGYIYRGGGTDVPVADGGTGASTLTDHGLILGSGVGAVTVLAEATDGQIPIGSTGNDPTLATITAGANINVANAAGSITVTATGTGIGPEFADNLFRVTDDGDPTAKLSFECDQITTGTVREITMCDQDLSLISPQFPGSVTAATGLTVTLGDATISGGNLGLPTTNAALTEGVIEVNSVRFIHSYGTDNLFVGPNSGNGTLAGADDNVGVGKLTLNALGAGDKNVAIGNNALTKASAASENIAIGYDALSSLLSALRNVAIGMGTLDSITFGDYNVAIGYLAGSTLATTDSDNILIMHDGVATDNNKIRIGTQGTGDGQQDNTFIAGIHGVTPVGVARSAIIAADGELGTLGAATDGQIPIGSTGANPSLSTITAGANISVVNGAGTITIAASGGIGPEFADNLFRVTDDGDPTAKLSFECDQITTGTVREITMCDQDLSLISPQFPGSVTAATGVTVTIGDVNISGGTLNLPLSNAALTEGTIEFNGATKFHTYGTDNVFIGDQVGNGTLSTASFNVGLGVGTLDALTTGTDNVGIGQHALGGVTTGFQHVGIGLSAGRAQQGGQGCVAIGNGALQNSINSSYNFALGFGSLNVLTAGNSNIGVGESTLRSLVTGGFNTAIGGWAGFNLTTNDSDNVNINHRGVVGDNNKIRIGTQGTGDGEQDNCFIAGINGITPVGVAEIAIIAVDGELGTLGAATNGQIPIGSTGANAVLATISAGDGISIANAAGSITISSPDSGVPWTEVTGTSQALAVNNAYILNNGALVTATLPAAAAVGDVIIIVGKGAGLWTIAQNASQTIHFISSDSTTGVGGSVSATVRYDCVELVCITANLDFCVRSSVGNLTIV